MNPIQETTRDAALREFLQDLPAETASPELRERIAQMARETDAQSDAQFAATYSRRAPRLRWALSGAVLATLAAIFVWVWPSVMSNQALAQINAAMARVSSLHMTRYRIEGGRRIKETETYFQGGVTREERLSDGFATLTKGGKRWFYSARAGTVVVGPEPVPDRGPRRTSPVFTLADLTRDFESRGEKLSLSPQGQTTLDGREVKRVTLQTQTDYETTQITLLVDVETDLPLRADINTRTRYGKTGRWQIEMIYNRRLSASLFQPKFAPGARFIDAGRRNADLKTRLARGLARKRVGERVVAIRELQVNRNGDVFLLYTAGKRLGKTTGDGFHSNNWFAGRDWKVFLSDSLGTHYHYMRNEFEFSLYPVGVQGQRLEGDWWVPATMPQPGQKWKPRTFFLNFEMSPKNLHGTFKQTFQIDYSARARFEIPVDEAENSVVPSLAQPLQTGLSEDSIIKQAAQERGELPPGVSPSPQLRRELLGIGAFSPDSSQIATGIIGGVQLVNTETGAKTRVLRVPAALAKLKVGAPLFSAAGRVLCAPVALGQTPETDTWWCVWNLQSGQISGSWRQNRVRDVSLQNAQLSADGTSLHLVNSVITKREGDGKIRWWVESQNIQVQEREVLTGKVLLERVLKHDGFVPSVDQAASGAADWQVFTNQLGSQKRGESGTTRAWSARSGAVTQTFGGAPGYENVRIVLARQARVLATWGNHFKDKQGSRHVEGKEIRIYDVATGQLQRTILPRTDWVSAFALSDDGMHLACEGEEHQISIWNTQTGQLEQSLTGHGTTVYSAVFSPDGQWLQSVDVKDKTLLWHLD